MERVIIVGEKSIPAKATAASLISYKANFSRDGLRDLLGLAKSIAPDGAIDVESFDLDVFFRFMWVFAKAADKSIPPLEQWLETFDMPPLDFVMEAMGQVVDMLSSTAGGTVKPKKRTAAAKVKQ